MKHTLVLVLFFFQQAVVAQVKIINNAKSSRSDFGVEKLKAVIKEYHLGSQKMDIILDKKDLDKKEGFHIAIKNNRVIITGNDESGVLYGCLDLADRIQAAKGFPGSLDVTDAPEMVLRGACVGLQKSTYLPGRDVYEYPITEQTFPWFYDKKLWLQVLDSMVDNRMNSLYLWNGHPFASLVKLKDYPYAVEVDDTTFKKNEEMYSFLTK